MNLGESSVLGLQSFTPVLGRKPSLDSVISNQYPSYMMEFLKESPRIFTRSFGSPCLPTPGVGMNPSVDFKSFVYTNHQIYDDVLINLQNKVAKETMARKWLLLLYPHFNSFVLFYLNFFLILSKISIMNESKVQLFC